MPARDHKAQIRGLERFVRQFRRSQMARKMVHGHQRKFRAIRQGLGKRQPHQKRTHEARPGRDGDAGQIRKLDLRLFQGFFRHLGNHPGMIPRSQLRHYATVGRMHFHLARHDTGEDLTTAAHDGGRHLVARTLDPEYESGFSQGRQGECVPFRRFGARAVLARPCSQCRVQPRVEPESA